MTYDGGPTYPTVPAVYCPYGHGVPPGSSYCPTCGSPVFAPPPPPRAAQQWGPPTPSRTSAALPASRATHRHESNRSGPNWAIILLVIAACGLLVTVAVVLVTVLGPGHAKERVSGTFFLTDAATASSGCSGQGVDTGIDQGALISLTGTDGKSVANTRLGSGVATGDVCAYPFSFPSAHLSQDSYSVGLTGVTPTTFTKSQMSSNHWRVDLRSGPPTTTVSGELDLKDIDTLLANCVGQGGYSDISQGASVIVTDQDQKIVGSASLDAGTASGGVCAFTFTVPNVREDEQQYAVQISHRGQVVQSAQTMQSSGWKFLLSLGS